MQTKALNLLKILSKNAYLAPSLLQFGKGTNCNHFKKCLIITKHNGYVEVSNSMAQQNPNSIDKPTP